MKALGGLLAGAALVLLPASVATQGTATRVMIRVVSHDAKIIGSAVGGARITVLDARTGSLLARGVQEGGTGDTQRLVVEPRARGQHVFDTEGAAGFLAELNLTRPTQVRIEAEGPLGTPQASQRISRTMLLVPGYDVLGEGVVLELYGFTVELLEPSGDLHGAPGTEIAVRARVTMLCGCPTEPAGLWDSSKYTIEARIVRDDTVLVTAPLAYAGETSIYVGRITVPAEDGLSLQILAMDPPAANFGMVERRFDEEGTGQSS
ncbi:MAG: hypothetical protein O2930_08260 [Acidobacteria bacterium]|nr:hypothetical protein [Acidobacteriota bacterium]